MTEPRPRPESVPPSTTPASSWQGDILVVDDTPANLQVLTGLLKDAGHRVRPASGGRMALRAARHKTPDLILLDVRMPDIDGYQVCRELKSDATFEDVPILFISAAAEFKDKASAFEIGCVDYITKPFEMEEVRARVETHLRLRRLRQELEARNRYVEDVNRNLLKLQELRDGLIHMIVHDMRSPLTGISTSLHFLKTDLTDQLNEQSQQDIERATRSCARLMRMINDLLDVNRMESDEMPVVRAATDVGDLIQSSLEMVRQPGEGQLVLPKVRSPLIVHCDAGITERVFANLIDNAIKYGGDGPIHIDASAEDSACRVTVSDSGPGIPNELQARVFDKFVQLEGRGSRGVPSTGLGLAFCKMAVESQGGEIGVTSESGRGSTFWVKLPRDESHQARSESKA